MMIRLTLFSALALATSAAGAQSQQADPRSAADAAKAFSLDLPAPADPATPPTAAPPMALVAFTLDTPIEQLIADPRAKAVLDADLPGLSGDSNLARFQAMSLHQFQPMTGGQLSNALLAKTGADLAAIGPPAMTAQAPAPVAPTANAATVRKKMDSGR